MRRDYRVDPVIESWLRKELDAVAEPSRAVQTAVAATAHVSQRQPILRRLRRIRSGIAAGEQKRAPLPSPETVIWADAAVRLGQQQNAASSMPASRSLPLPMALMATGLAAIAGLAAVLMVMGPGSSLFGSVGPAGAERTAAPALILGAPLEGGREIVVAADGSGHFWSISDAIAVAVDGDRIAVEPGTYQGSVVVTQNVSITGRGDRDAVVVVPAPRGPDSDPSAREFVFRLEQTDATISGMTIRGARVGTAIVIEGGAPTLEDLVIDAPGEQALSNPSKPRQAVEFRGGTRATLRSSRITAFTSIEEPATPLLDGNEFVGTCVRIDGVGADPTVQGNTFDQSACPEFSIAVSGGAQPILVGNIITNGEGTDGIRVVGSGTNAEISSQVIRGGAYGIWIATGARATVRSTLVSGASTGVAVSDAEATLESLDLRLNGIGLLIDGGARPELLGNTICDNTLKDVDQRIDPPVSLAGNEVTSPCTEEAVS
ncbi:MAG: NosD domain-containing protein [Chloroflexota bacterium]